MTVIYIRHAKDKKDRCEHDERLTEEAKEDVKEFTKKLIEENGFPDIIYYSPYYRTRQTTKYMLKQIKRMDESKKVKISIEPKLGRFFTSKERKNPDIHESTQRRNPIIHEDKKGFHARIKKHLKSVSKKGQDKVIWNVTHTLVLLRVASLLNIERDPHVEYLDVVTF